MCAAPGGKSIHAADKMGDYGNVDARDVSQYKADLIKENIHRTGVINVDAKVQDATVYDPDSEQAADIVIADVPCSGYGVIGKKPEIKYRATPQKQEEIVMLQRMILDKAAKYVKPDGTLIFSTCTIAREETKKMYYGFKELSVSTGKSGPVYSGRTSLQIHKTRVSAASAGDT